MKLFDATLDLAAFAKGTEDYTVTAVNGRQLTCSRLSGRVSEFGRGTVWVRSGESAGYFGKIRSASAQTINLEEVVAIAPGDEITIGAWLEFDLQDLINAVNSVLRMYRILKQNDELLYDPDVFEYDLPEGVTEDIRSVLLPRPWGIESSHYWRVENGKLMLYGKYISTKSKDQPIRLNYVDYHGAVGKDDVISGQVDPLYLRYMSWLYLCRHLIQKTHKDNLVSSDMYNEAKIYERDYGRLPNKRLPLKVMTFPAY